MTRATTAIMLAALLTVWAVPVSAQRGGETWKPLIPGLRTQFAAKPDPEVGTRLALVYAHEGMIYDGYRVLRQVDQTIGGAQGGSTADTNRSAFARRLSVRALAEVGQDPPQPAGPLRVGLRIVVPGGRPSYGDAGDAGDQPSRPPQCNEPWVPGLRLRGPQGCPEHDRAMGRSHPPGSPQQPLALQAGVGLQSRRAVARCRPAVRPGVRDRTLYNYITRGEQP